MNLLSRINLFVILFVDVFRQMGRWRLWWPLLLYGAFQWLILYAHYRFAQPYFQPVILPWIDLVGPEGSTGFLHYPQQMILLAYYYGWAKLLVGVLFEGLVMGVVADRFYGVFNGDSPVDRPFWWRWLNLSLAWIVLSAGLVAAGQILPDLLSSFLASSPRRQLAFSFVFMPAVYALVIALFYLAIPKVITDGLHGPAALWGSLREFLRQPIFLYLLAGLVMAGPLLLGALIGQSATIVRDFRPELTYWILVFTLAVEAVAYFVWMGTAVKLLSVRPE